jgi:ABC-type multidrug transport system fused ATPase/permease subunit
VVFAHTKGMIIIMRKKNALILNFIFNIYFCLKIIFTSSKSYAIIRFTVEILLKLLPLCNIYIIKLIIDILSQGNVQKNYLAFYSLILLFLTVLIATTALNKVDDFIAKVQDETITNIINKKIIQKASTIDLKFFDSSEYYDKLQLIKINTYAINEVVWDLLSFISAFIALVVSFVVVWDYNKYIACLILVAYLPLLISNQAFIRKIYNYQITNVDEERKMSYVADIASTRTHAKSVRFFGLSNYLLCTFSGIWNIWFKKRKKIMKHWMFVTLALSIIPHVLTIYMLYNLGLNILNGANSIGDFSLYSGILAQIVSNLFIIVNSVINISGSIIRAKDFRGFMNIKNLVEDSGEKILENINEIEFNNVYFTYPGNEQPTLKNINIKIHGKEKIALIGTNGAGKTTIIKLLLRFYEPSDGTILINGIDIKKYSSESIREQFSVMFQDYINYAFSLRENLKLSDLHNVFEDSQLIEICKKSGVYDFSKKWKNGLDTFLYKEFDDNGMELSGGQNQKISLARMFSRNRNFILLDEPSASLDPESEFNLINNIAKECDKKGLIFITHRLSNISLVERILVLEHGEIIEDGTHNELMANNGRYAKMFNQQASKYTKMQRITN